MNKQTHAGLQEWEVPCGYAEEVVDFASGRGYSKGQRCKFAKTFLPKMLAQDPILCCIGFDSALHRIRFCFEILLFFAGTGFDSALHRIRFCFAMLAQDSILLCTGFDSEHAVLFLCHIFSQRPMNDRKIERFLKRAGRGPQRLPPTRKCICARPSGPAPAVPERGPKSLAMDFAL